MGRLVLLLLHDVGRSSLCLQGLQGLLERHGRWSCRSDLLLLRLQHLLVLDAMLLEGQLVLPALQLLFQLLEAFFLLFIGLGA